MMEFFAAPFMLNQNTLGSSSQPQTHQRFDVLDGLRGIAAILVMILHYAANNGLAWFVGAWVCVDLFFILSGFVIAHSYGEKILKGLSFKKFVALRIIRLAPLYFLGLLLGIIGLLLAAQKNPALPVTSNAISSAITWGLLGLPYFNHVAWPFGGGDIIRAVFPLNEPAWTLFFEFFINLVFFYYAHIFRRTSSTKLVVVAFFIFTACILWFKQIHSGWSADNFIFGFPRVFFGFFLGALIFSQGFHLKKQRLFLSLGLAALFFILCASSNGKVAFLNSILLAPLVIGFCASVEVNQRVRQCCAFLGALSYPLYILHIPVYRLMVIFWGDELTSPAYRVILAMVCAIGIASIAGRFDTLLRQKMMAFFFPLSSPQKSPWLATNQKM
jgi:peptidoglycan/LPS O-acetylase OafA/YrhL